MTGQTVILRGPRQRAFAKSLIDQAPVDAVVNIREASRTLEQNAKMHAMLDDICAAKPRGIIQGKDLWKCAMMRACGHEIAMATSHEGMIFPAGYQSSHLSVREMSELLDFMDIWGTENGVRWHRRDMAA